MGPGWLIEQIRNLGFWADSHSSKVTERVPSFTPLFPDVQRWKLGTISSHILFLKNRKTFPRSPPKDSPLVSLARIVSQVHARAKHWQRRCALSRQWLRSIKISPGAREGLCLPQEHSPKGSSAQKWGSFDKGEWGMAVA